MAKKSRETVRHLCPKCRERTYPMYYHGARAELAYIPVNRRYCKKCDKIYKIEMMLEGG